MKTKSISFSSFLLAAWVCSGCSADSPLGILLTPPECSIVSVQKTDASPGNFAESDVLVSNTGSGGTAYNVVCQVKVKRGNLILDVSGADIGTLGPGESRIGTVMFTEIQSHKEYDYSDYHVWWYDADGGYHDLDVVNP